MKKSLKIIMISIIIITLSGCTLNFRRYEDKLYSERDLIGYGKNNTDSNYNVVSKEGAIEKAIYGFDKVFNIKIDRSKLQENIVLSKDYVKSNLNWKIEWLNKFTKEKYTCVVNYSDGVILQIEYDNMELKQSKTHPITSSEMVSIITIPLKEFKINISDYKMSSYPLSYYGQECYCSFENIKNPNKGFKIGVDSKNRKVILFNVSNKVDWSMEENK